MSDEVGHIKAALKVVRQSSGLTPARDFGPLALRTVRDQMIASGLACSMVNARINRVRRAFPWAVSMEMIPVEVVAALGTVDGLLKGRTSAREPEPIGPVPDGDSERTLPFLSRTVAGVVRFQIL